MKRLIGQLEHRVDVSGVRMWWPDEGKVSVHQSGPEDFTHPRYIDLLIAFDDLNRHINKLNQVQGIMAEIIQRATKGE
jgi:hypothetical protein